MIIKGFNKEETVAINTFVDAVLENANKKAIKRGDSQYTDSDVAKSLYELHRDLPQP